MTVFESFSEGPLRLEGKYREAILEEGSKTFRLLPNMGRFLCFSRHHGFFFQPLFVPIPLIRKGVFFCLHSFPPVSVKMCLFYCHSINSGSNVDRMFLDFWKRSVRPEGSLKFDCVILHVLPNRSTVLRRPGSLPTTSFLVRDYE